VWVGLPALSGISVDYLNSAFGIDDLLVQEGKDSLYVDMDLMYKSLRKQNIIHVGNEISLLTVGVKINSWYATLDVTEKNDFILRANKDLFSFLKQGNRPYLGKTMDIGDLGLQLNAYEEFALGLSKKVNSKWTVGGRMKFLLGIANASMVDSKISIESAEDASSMKIRSKQDIRISAPVEFSYEKEGEYINWDDFDADVDDFSTSMVLNTKNPGFALDLGAEYQFNDKLKFYASVVDLGFIRWGAKNYHFTQNALFDWQGGDLSNSIKEDDKSIDDVFDDLIDRLKDNFRFHEKRVAYTNMLRTKMYLGATYQIARMVSVAGVAELTLMDKVFYPSLTASADVRLLKNVSAAVSYSVMPGNYVNLGAALTAKLGPVQLYASTDNVLVANYTRTQSLNARFGINLLFGHKDKKKKGQEEEEPVTETVVVPVKKEPEVKKDAIVRDTIVQDSVVQDSVIQDTIVQDSVVQEIPPQPLPFETLVISPVREEMMIEGEVENEIPYHVVVGSFKERQRAERLKNEMKRVGFKEAQVFQNEKGLFRVSCMSFGSHEEAWDKVFEIRKKYPKYRDAWTLKVN
ncbi:MAG: SPOR domain-containing protein, partial [Odoribacter sp.]|nr:SPOR domain-containing protein [Odoribacter sp.]